MSKKIYWITVSLVSLLLIMKAGIVLSQEAAPADPQEATSSEPQSIHQRASICMEDFEATFPDEPSVCQDVCDSCHTYATVVPDSLGNPQAFTTDEIYPEAPVDEVSWDTIGLLQGSCRDCHIKEIDPVTNHAVFVEHGGDSSENFKETKLKLFKGQILCTTCHSPHSGNVALLRVPNQGSALCMDCHTI
jgi:predicted CXXCH cytochrome family protein